ncbi:hypothetical protein MJO28_009040 [Puccinia striiformis f. sp. tritici]|uniref:Uncharacterized protein n=1 Tax=Puccinia striiformis f. sp. tritici TaxID=168172 RepID=A0ACC0ED36_9BASI|nr:hypothetical protein Pst134EB_016061 [Puccinia striiformis f. sp. tritici]KAI7950219.1 hypothetical protein MJO28_009040 [Puccinia striiformis f. sp. tritici]
MASIPNGFLHQIHLSYYCRSSCPVFGRIPRGTQLNPIRQYSHRTRTKWSRKLGSKDGRASFTTSACHHQSNQSEKALMDELRRLSHRQDSAQPMLGPFMMPRGTANEKAMRQDEYYHWSRVGWSERIRRIFRMGRNLVIVSFGGCLGILVIYSITSELFAPSSTTNLMNMTIKTIEESEELSKILKSPIKFHTSPTPSGSKRTSGIPQSFQHQNGVVELRFWVESCKPSLIEGDWKSLEWWKSWIGPLITSEVYHHPKNRSSSDQSSHSRSQDLDPSESHSTQSSWWPGLLKSIMPNTLGRSSSSSNDSRSWSERFFSNHGSFEHGEVVAELIKESDGKWKYKSLVIDFPDSQTSKYRLNVHKELKKIKTPNRRLMGDETGDLGEPKQTATRYRFWNRKINL